MSDYDADVPEDPIDDMQQSWGRERPDIDPSPHGVIGRLHRLSDQLRAELVAVYREHGLGEGDFDVLASLRRVGHPYELHAGELAQHTMVTTGGMTKRLDRLEKAGLIKRRVDEADARIRCVALTEHGVAVIDAAYTDHMANEHRLLEAISETDRRQLERILRDWLAARAAD